MKQTSITELREKITTLLNQSRSYYEIATLTNTIYDPNNKAFLVKRKRNYYTVLKLPGNTIYLNITQQQYFKSEEDILNQLNPQYNLNTLSQDEKHILKSIQSNT